MNSVREYEPGSSSSSEDESMMSVQGIEPGGDAWKIAGLLQRVRLRSPQSAKKKVRSYNILVDDEADGDEVPDAESEREAEPEPEPDPQPDPEAEPELLLPEPEPEPDPGPEAEVEREPQPEPEAQVEPEREREREPEPGPEPELSEPEPEPEPGPTSGEVATWTRELVQAEEAMLAAELRAVRTAADLERAQIAAELRVTDTRPPLWMMHSYA